jgi:long-subunit acyl-CoA synthetase (AMP-forming)
VLCCALTCCAGDMTGGRWGPFWDKLVFSKIRERVGGEVKYMTTGRDVDGGVVSACTGSLHLTLISHE